MQEEKPKYLLRAWSIDKKNGFLSFLVSVLDNGSTKEVSIDTNMPFKDFEKAILMFNFKNRIEDLENALVELASAGQLLILERNSPYSLSDWQKKMDEVEKLLKEGESRG